MDYTTDNLLTSIKQKAFVPVSQITFKDEDILAMATNELYDTIVPLVLQTREEFYVTYQDVAIIEANQKIDIPERAIGLAIREVSLISGGNETNVTRYDIDELPTLTSTGTLAGFYIQGNQICLIGNTSGSVRLYYHARPGSLVKTTRAARITSIAGNIVTVSSIGSAWTTPGVSVDLIKARPGFDALSTPLVVSASGTSVTLNAVPSRLSTSDWICQLDTSPVPQIPVEFYSYLAQLTAVQLLDSLGDIEAKNSAAAKLEKMEANALAMVTPRVVGESKKIVNFYNRNSTTYRGY